MTRARRLLLLAITVLLAAALREWAARLPDTSLLDARTKENLILGRILAGPGLAAGRGLEHVFRRRVRSATAWPPGRRT